MPAGRDPAGISHNVGELKMASEKRRIKKRRKTSGVDTTLWVILGGAGLFLLLCCGGGLFFASKVYHQVAGHHEIPAGESYAQWRSTFETNLIRRGPAPQEYELEQPPQNVIEIVYQSGALPLKAWVYQPPDAQERRPALIFCHGGFAFGSGDLLEACAPAIEAGLVVMTPMFRGENGNPGNFELFFGEADDARAAAKWLAEQPYVDPDQIYAFGHSVGGGISAMLSLLDDVPIRHSGSSGGLYPPTVFLGWMDVCPFRNTPEERAARLLLGNIRHMQRKHFAYLGTEDDFGDAARSAGEEGGADSLLAVEMVPGDHFSSFDESLRRYLAIIRSER